MKKIFATLMLMASTAVFADLNQANGNDSTTLQSASSSTSLSRSNSAALSGNSAITGNSPTATNQSGLAGSQNSGNVVNQASDLSQMVPNVSAPNLATTLTETCMGSTSGGASAAGWGFSFGTTWRDSACVRRLDARQMSAFNDISTAREMMCDSELVREAAKRVGKPCMEDGGVPFGQVAPLASRDMPAPVIQQAPSEEAAAAVVQQRVHE